MANTIGTIIHLTRFGMNVVAASGGGSLGSLGSDMLESIPSFDAPSLLSGLPILMTSNQQNEEEDPSTSDVDSHENRLVSSNDNNTDATSISNNNDNEKKTKDFEDSTIPPMALPPKVSTSNTVGNYDINNGMRITTKIVGFADQKYMEIAYNWYKRLESFGYDTHYVVTSDEIAATYFQTKQIRYDYLFHDNATISPTKLQKPFVQCIQEEHNKTALSESKQNQNYRRHLFGSRWNYILRQLQGIGNKNQQRYHILLTDVDNVFVRYANMTAEIEETPYDAYHAFEGKRPSFPKNYWYQHGFTICGGMSWFRSTPSIIEFVSSVAKGCGCDDVHVVTCNCRCDDQQMINSKIFSGPYKMRWDRHIHKPDSDLEIDWDSLTGTCKKTGHRVKVWDRHTAYRGRINRDRCPHEPQHWIAMPSGIDDRISLPKLWDDACGIGRGNKTWIPTPRTTKLEHWSVRKARREKEELLLLSANSTTNSTLQS